LSCTTVGADRPRKVVAAYASIVANIARMRDLKPRDVSRRSHGLRDTRTPTTIPEI
jgi:hypothetical protein